MVCSVCTEAKTAATSFERVSTLCSHSLTWVRSPLMRATSLLTLLLAVSRYNNLQTGPDTCQATLGCNGINISAEATCCSTAFICWTVREINWGMCQRAVSSTPKHHPRSYLQKSCPQAYRISTKGAHSLVKCFVVVARLSAAVTVPILLFVCTCAQSHLLQQGWSWTWPRS